MRRTLQKIAAAVSPKKMLNPMTGKSISIGKDSYKRAVREGYIVENSDQYTKKGIEALILHGALPPEALGRHAKDVGEARPSSPPLEQGKPLKLRDTSKKARSESRQLSSELDDLEEQLEETDYIPAVPTSDEKRAAIPIDEDDDDVYLSPRDDAGPSRDSYRQSELPKKTRSSVARSPVEEDVEDLDEVEERPSPRKPQTFTPDVYSDSPSRRQPKEPQRYREPLPPSREPELFAAHYKKRVVKNFESEDQDEDFNEEDDSIEQAKAWLKAKRKGKPRKMIANQGHTTKEDKREIVKTALEDKATLQSPSEKKSAGSRVITAF